MARVLLMTTNGTGMGHLSRQTAIALALAGRHDPTLFSLSAALPVVLDALRDVVPGGLRGEYAPSYSRGWMPAPDWHPYLADRVSALLRETGARVVVFDGVAPYAGLLQARAANPDVAFVWCRRALWRPGLNAAALRAEPFFDLVLEPGDLAGSADRGATVGRAAVRVGPVSLGEQLPALPRAEAAHALGLDPARPTALVTLPPGGASQTAVDALLADPAWQVAVTSSPIAEAAAGTGGGRVVALREVYPLVRYLPAVDAAVSAAGYNAVHELLLTAVPTLLVPNPGVVTDDQAGRARWAWEAGAALLADPGDLPAVAAAAARLRDPLVRGELAAACRSLPRPVGAAQAAEVLAGLLADPPGRHSAGLPERLRLADLSARRSLSRLLGRGGSEAVRRLLGRRPLPGPARPLAVRLGSEPETAATVPGEPVPCLLTERLDAAVLRSGVVVEHLLPGSSPAYREQRLLLIGRYYRPSGGPLP